MATQAAPQAAQRRKQSAKTPARSEETEEQTLLVEMAHRFQELERLETWPQSVRSHCAVWAALMKVEIPRKVGK